MSRSPSEQPNSNPKCTCGAVPNAQWHAAECPLAKHDLPPREQPSSNELAAALWAEIEECMSNADWNEQSRENLRRLVRAAIPPTVTDFGVTPTLAAVRMAINTFDDDRDERRVLEEIQETVRHALTKEAPQVPGIVVGMNLAHKSGCDYYIRGKAQDCTCKYADEKPARPRGKPCTCDNCLGSSCACRVDAGEKLGELWYCQKRAAAETSGSHLDEGRCICLAGVSDIPEHDEDCPRRQVKAPICSCGTPYGKYCPVHTGKST